MNKVTVDDQRLWIQNDLSHRVKDDPKVMNIR
jgi:hypothetical protein